MTGVEWKADADDQSVLGTLNLSNGTSKDGVVVLYQQMEDDTEEALRAIYVRSHERATMLKVSPAATR